MSLSVNTPTLFIECYELDNRSGHLSYWTSQINRSDRIRPLVVRVYAYGLGL